MKKIIILLASFLCFSSCLLIKGWRDGRKYVRPEKVKKEVVSEAEKLLESKNLDSLFGKLSSGLQSIPVRQFQQDKVIEKLESYFQNVDYSDLSKKTIEEMLTNIKGLNKNIQAELVNVRISYNKIMEKLTPDYINKISDSLVNIETLKLSKRKDTSIRKKEISKIKKDIEIKLAKIIMQEVQKAISLNDTYNALLVKKSTIIFELTQCFENLSLHKYILIINNESNFELGSEFLNEEGKKVIVDYANLYYDSLYSKLNYITSILNDTNSKYLITLNAHCDAYSDTKRFSKDGETYFSKFMTTELSTNEIEKRGQLNLVLSQRRADEIMKIFEDVYSKKKSEEKESNKYKFEIIPICIGHGEELPKRRKEIIYEPDGEEDFDRRINFLECIFKIEKTN